MNNSRSLSFENLFLVLFQGFMCGQKQSKVNTCGRGLTLFEMEVVSCMYTLRLDAQILEKTFIKPELGTCMMVWENVSKHTVKIQCSTCT